jgi:hypothetical protein
MSMCQACYALLCVLHADLTCDGQTNEDLTQKFMSLACFLGDMSTIGSATCTLSYMPTDAARAALAVDTSLNEITGSVTFEPFLPTESNVVERGDNNGVTTCAMDQAVPGPLP